MPSTSEPDAVVIGSGPNGLAAAVRLAQAGRSVLVLEQAETIGGGARTAELTLPGFRHDVCSAIHPMGAASPYFDELPLRDHGLQWVHPEAPLAHPLDDGSVALLERSTEATVRTLDPVDADAYRNLFDALARDFRTLARDVLGPLRPPRHPVMQMRFGLPALRSAVGLCHDRFRGRKAAALFGGLAAHSILPLEELTSAAIGLMLGAAGHAVGWPFPRGGSQSISDALASLLESLGGTIETGRLVERLEDVPSSRVVLMDLTPRQVVSIAGDHLPGEYRRRLERYRYGPGVFKVDWALDEPIPWCNPDCAKAATVHIGGTLEELSVSERTPWEERHAERPYVLLAQQSLFDDTRAPDGKHTGWAYCHVPHGSGRDMTAIIEDQVERFAPGFGDVILARHAHDCASLERWNPNCVGGDITGGVADLRQLFFRPAPRINPYATPNRRLFLCSSSTPPGAGVHGMCGYHAAGAALKRF